MNRGRRQTILSAMGAPTQYHHLTGNPQGGTMRRRSELLREFEEPGKPTRQMVHDWNHLPGRARRYGAREVRPLLESNLTRRLHVIGAMKIGRVGTYDHDPNSGLNTNRNRHVPA